MFSWVETEPIGRLIALALMAAVAGVLSACELSPADAEAKDPDYQPYKLVLLPSPSARTIAEAQKHLGELGYQPGPVDGVLGKQTRIAIQHFQVDEEVEIDGELTPDLLSRLEKAVARRNAAIARRSKASLSGDRGGATGQSSGPPEPMYEVDDVYVYSDGRVERVMRVGPEQIAWMSVEGSTYNTYRNFILPPVSWKHGSSSGENRITPPEGRKWPLATEGWTTFEVMRGSAGVQPSQGRKWRCAAGDETRIRTVTGEYAAIVVECERANPVPGTWKKRVWYFVPRVGHYVRRSDLIEGDGHEVSVDLIAVRPGGKGWPAAARGGLDWAIQDALQADDDKLVEWRSSAIGATFEIRVFGAADLAPDATCRRYVITRVDSEQRRDFPGIACREEGQARWLTPGIDAAALPPASIIVPQG